MPPMPLVVIALHFSHMLTVYAVGLEATLQDGTYLFRRPGQLLRIIIAMNVVMPALVIFAIQAVRLVPAVEIALVALAVSPVPPLLLERAHSAKCEPGYVTALLVSSCCLAPIMVPAGVAMASLLHGRAPDIVPARVLPEVATGVIAPLLAGIATRRFAPGWAEAAAKPLFLAATRLFWLSAMLVVVLGWGAILVLAGNGTWLAFALFVALGLLIGHLIGGPGPRRTAVALAVASRHPGIALALATVYFPGQTLVAPALVTYVLTSELVALPYIRWIKRRQAAALVAGLPGDGHVSADRAPQLHVGLQDIDNSGGKHGEAKQTEHSNHLGR